MNLKLFFIGNIFIEFLQDYWFIFFDTFNLFLFVKKIKNEYMNICYIIFVLNSFARYYWLVYG